jgi:hypothetical protein
MNVRDISKLRSLDAVSDPAESYVYYCFRPLLFDGIRGDTVIPMAEQVLLHMSASVLRIDAACWPAAKRVAYLASLVLATTHDIIDENTWMEPLILVGSLWLPRKKIAPATDSA